MGSSILLIVVFLATGYTLYFFLKWKEVWTGSPIQFALYGMVVHLVTGVLLTIVTGNPGWLWSLGRMAIWAGPTLYVMIWLIRKYALGQK